MTSDLQLFRIHLSSVRRRELQSAHLLAVGSTDHKDYARIVAGHSRVFLLDQLLVDLKELENSPGEFVKRNIKDE